MKVGYLSGMEVSARGLEAQRAVMNAAAENLANLHTTKTESGDPYRRQVTSLEQQPIPGRTLSLPGPQAEGLSLTRTDPAHLTPVSTARLEDASQVGVEAKVHEDQSEFPTIYDPGHPDADEQGMVRMPNVDMAQEMVTMMAASRAYEANLAALQTARKLAESALNLAR